MTSKNTKLKVSIRLWQEIKRNEMAISSDLRDHAIVANAYDAIIKIQGMMD